MSGTYGISLAGTSFTYTDPGDHVTQITDSSHAATDSAGLNGTTGVMLLSVPQRGLSVAKTLIFDQGLMYLGTSTGVVKVSNGQGGATLITQLTHYAVRTTTDGSTSATSTYATDMLNGVMKLKISPDYFTGITSVSGSGTFWAQDLRLTTVVNSTTSTSDAGAGAGPVTTTTITTTTPGSDTVDPAPKIIDSPIQTNNPERAPSLTVSADGTLQSASVTNENAFTIPSAATVWGVGAGETGVATAAGVSN